MSKFCSKCGKELNNTASVCPDCGTKVATSAMVENKDIAMCVILSILTCGIYGIYWFIRLTDDSNSVCDIEKTTSGGMALILTLVTCGIYSIYWNYKLGRKLYEAGRLNNVDIADNSVLYLILSLFGFSIVSWCLAQSDLNKLAK